MNELSIVIPAYSEEENLRILLPRLVSTAKSLTNHFEIIVVDTVEPLDHTREVCALYGVKYLNRKAGNNFGDAIRMGISEAAGEYILLMDADGSHPPEFVSNLWTQRKRGYIVIASRYIEGGYSENDKILIWMSKLVNWGFSRVLNIRCRDLSNSFRIYHAPLIKSLDLKCTNFDIVEELLFKAIRLNPNIGILEIPFSFKQRMFGESKRNLVAFIFTYFFTLLKLRFFL